MLTRNQGSGFRTICTHYVSHSTFYFAGSDRYINLRASNHRVAFIDYVLNIGQLLIDFVCHHDPGKATTDRDNAQWAVGWIIEGDVWNLVCLGGLYPCWLWHGGHRFIVSKVCSR